MNSVLIFFDTLVTTIHNHKPKNVAASCPYDFEIFVTFTYKIHMYHGVHDDNTT
jgi:hypothetical protein